MQEETTDESGFVHVEFKKLTNDYVYLRTRDPDRFCLIKGGGRCSFYFTLTVFKGPGSVVRRTTKRSKEASRWISYVIEMIRTVQN